MLTVSDDKTARVWERATGNLIRKLEGHDWGVLCGQFSPDGQRVITGSQDNTARIWDLTADDAESSKPLTLGGHTAAITAVAFSPDGTRVLTGSQDNTAKLWDAQTGKEILSLPGHTQEVTSVAFSPDGLSVLTSSRDGTAIIWQAKEWREKTVAAIKPHRAGLRPSSDSSSPARDPQPPATLVRNRYSKIPALCRRITVCDSPPTYNRIKAGTAAYMTLKLQLSPEIEAKLRERAAQFGQSPETLVMEALQEKLSSAVDPEESLSPSLRMAEFSDWFQSHPTSKAAALDDSRESIYNGRGE